MLLTLGKVTDFNERGLYTDLGREFIKNGHTLFVVNPVSSRTTVPQSRIDNVTYLNVYVGSMTKAPLFIKLINTIMFENRIIRMLRKNISLKDISLFLFSTPPSTYDQILKYIKKRFNAHTYLLLKDIFPQNSVDLGLISKKNPIYWYFRYKEKKMYSFSDKIGCMSEGNMKYIKHVNGIPDYKLEVNPNSIDPLPSNYDESIVVDFRGKYSIPADSVVFLYGGNLGRPQGLNFLLDVIDVLKNRKDLYFLIVGEGTEYNKIKETIEKSRFNNVQLIKAMNKLEYEMLVKACDVGMVLLNNKFTVPNFPSRVLSYMQAGLPVIAAIDHATDFGDFIMSENIGYYCYSNSTQDFLAIIERLLDKSERLRLGLNSRKVLESKLNVTKTYDLIIRSVKEIT